VGDLIYVWQYGSALEEGARALSAHFKQWLHRASLESALGFDVASVPMEIPMALS